MTAVRDDLARARSLAQRRWSLRGGCGIDRACTRFVSREPGCTGFARDPFVADGACTTSFAAFFEALPDLARDLIARDVGDARGLGRHSEFVLDEGVVRAFSAFRCLVVGLCVDQLDVGIKLGFADGCARERDEGRAD